MNKSWILDYNTRLFLNFPDGCYLDFTKSVFYKLSLKRYVEKSEPGHLDFKSNLSYLQMIKIISLFESKFKAVKVDIGDNLKQYIKSKENYIEERYRVGNEIKNQDSKILDIYNKYKSVVNDKMDRKLRDKQMWDSFFMCSMKKAANFSVPGSGKTSSVLGVYSYLKSIGQVSRILVICPKNAFGSWIDEFNTCFKGKEELSLFNIHDEKYKSVSQRKSALFLDSGNVNLFLINYESLKTYIKEAQAIVKNKTLLVYDEVHKVKSIEGEYSKYALKLSEYSNYTIVMTGTPIPNGYQDIYNFLNILFPNEYKDFFNFTPEFLKNPSSTEIQGINDKIQPFFCRTTKDELQVPKASPDEIITIDANHYENELLHILQMKYRKNQLALFIRILQLETNPQLLLNKLDLKEFQYLLDDSVEDFNDIEYGDYREQLLSLINKIPVASKFDTCIDLVRQKINQGKSLIIWCIFKDSITSIYNTLSSFGIKAHCVYGEIPLSTRENLIKDFKDNKYNVLITNPHTLAESISLHTVCHDAIYFEYSYNLVHLLQSKDRIHRLGLPKNQYTQYYFLEQEYELPKKDQPWSMDKNVYDRLKIKEEIMLDAILNRKLENMPSSEEDLQKIFSELNLYN